MSITVPELSAAAAAPTKKSVKRANQLPDTALALSAVATTAAGAWTNADLPGLLWLSKAEFSTAAGAFATACAAADAAGDARSPQSARLRALDKLLDKGLGFVKGYLHEDKDDETAYYGDFGIEKLNKNYRLPKGRTERVVALGKLQAALVKYKYDKKKYGTAYWAPLATEYAALVQQSTGTAGERSGKVSDKVQGEQKLRKALRALIHHLKANYPDTFEAKLREFGFQKESY
ncbi:hypothetical protein [Hymenobacter persicinus]|uniref:Uncharacterized protein n=1 Tax=Hymenobacter persicinus TaxID=2025506 RepID=A0A4Q5LGU2_9BACT|nr:hypothetical protein [Hymenobacter persicinus]RYU81008.1 hypothetical protein EWM57_07135 [Hymenobacter persicinus]